ncbi:MAG: hypothetical protein M1570_06570 [Chloroflexi bacterium]|nr:hypothetical protein [Chloroflexota bacterium]
MSLQIAAACKPMLCWHTTLVLNTVVTYTSETKRPLPPTSTLAGEEVGEGGTRHNP